MPFTFYYRFSFLNLNGTPEDPTLLVERLRVRLALTAERGQDVAMVVRLGQIVHLLRIGFQVEKHFEVGLTMREIAPLGAANGLRSVS